MKSECLLGLLEDVANLSTAMLVAARQEDWKEVGRLKERAGFVIDEIRVLSDTVPLSAGQRRVKLATMRRILANDGQIQEIAQPWLRRVAQWLSPSARAASHFEGLPR